MSFFRVRSFRGRIFLAILVVGLVPAAMALAGGAWILQSIGTRSGTLGPWDAVAETGQELLDGLDASPDANPELREAARGHREALSESVRMSRLYSFVADRVVSVLPVAALFAGLVVGAVAYYVAGRLARGFGGPVAELAGWTERIARHEPLPPEDHQAASVEELGTLQAALRRMARELEEGRRRELENARMRSWTQLARRVAHEIKNPLTPMRMAALSLTRGREATDAEAGKILLDEIDRLDQMARTFSQFGRIPEGPRSLVDIVELLSMLAAQHRTGRVPVEVASADGPILVEAHYDALERAFRNLLLNALEAQEVTGGRVRLSASSLDDRAVVVVEDEGPGIPPELLDDIWSPDVTTKSRGTGLGLAIVRQTITHHGGEATAANREGGGARFEVRLPLAPRHEPDTTTNRP